MASPTMSELVATSSTVSGHRPPTRTKRALPTPPTMARQGRARPNQRGPSGERYRTGSPIPFTSSQFSAFGQSRNLSSPVNGLRSSSPEDDGGYAPSPGPDELSGPDEPSGPDESSPGPGETELASEFSSEGWVDDTEGPFFRELRFPPHASVQRWISAGEGTQRQLARRILYALHVGVIPCPEEVHSRAERRHNDNCTRHRGLRHTYDVLSKEYPASQAECSEGLGLYRETSDIPPVWAAKQRQEFPSHGRLSRLFSGSLHDGEEICLHRDAPSRPPLQHSVKDIDSSIAIFSDLNRFQKPISLTIIPQPASLLKKSIHLSYPVEVNGKVKSVPIHKIPHMLFATAGTRSHAIYAFFPAMYSPDPKASVYLSDKAYQAFYEDIIHPGLLQLPLRARSGHLGDGWAETSQHLPATFEAALAISRAAAERSGNEGGTRGRPINITFNPSSDPQVWDEIFLRLRDPTAQEPGEYDRRSFCNLFFLYDSKGTKLETQRQRALGPCIQDFRAEQAAYFPENAAVSSDDRQYIDIATTVYALNDGHYPLGSTLLAKRCCVYNTVRTILEGEDEPTEGTGLRDTGPAAARPPQPPRTVVTEYPINLLRDTVTLTAEPTATHPHAADRLVYIQTYSPVKELFDARGIFPFSHPGILNLGYSNVDCSTIHSLQRTASDRPKAKASDCRSRKRVRIATDPDGGGSGWFGWRTELRVSLALVPIAGQVQLEQASGASQMAGGHGPLMQNRVDTEQRR